MTTLHHHHNHLPEESCNEGCFADVETSSSDREHRFFAALTRIKHHAELHVGVPTHSEALLAALPDFIQSVMDGENPHELSLP
ncbi:MAG: hypothetical protein KGR26_04875 [Cyanobacteria bacterium REEB65]|nr:hypothetical protein [Cyanobacteria bacterium REEB65]